MPATAGDSNADIVSATVAGTYHRHRAFEQGHQVQCVHPNFHQHFIIGKKPKKGRDIAMIFQDKNKHLELIKHDAQTHLSEPSFIQAGL
jgi:hypothetical protein